MKQDNNFIEKQEENISIHIFSVSAAMIGVCITVIGILHIRAALKKIEPVGDGIMAVDAIIFLLSCFISFIAMRTQDKKKRLFLERISDAVFLSGLSLMVLICVLIAAKLI
jgi:hypothetical protein